MTHSPVKHLHSLPVLLNKPPQAWADLRGDALHPDIYGIVLFHQTPDGVIIATDVSGLPHGQGTCSGRFFAFHIHEGSACRGSATDPFSAAGGHFNPAGCSHPYHAGDLPPLLGCGGDAMTVFLTDRFRLDEVIGRTVVIHENADDFTTQPAGNARRAYRLRRYRALYHFAATAVLGAAGASGRSAGTFSRKRPLMSKAIPRRKPAERRRNAPHKLHGYFRSGPLTALRCRRLRRNRRLAVRIICPQCG